jgi:iron complex outermembrane receptor protein
LSDPPLRQVVSRSVETGLRLSLREQRGVRLRATLAAFGSRNQDDILFVAGSRLGTGYFRNAGSTQRLGAELGADLSYGALDAFARYTLLRATFESKLVLPGADHPRARTDALGRRVIDVAPGDHIPGVPAHRAKLGAHVRVLDGLRIGAEAQLVSGVYFRGDEANLLDTLPSRVVVGADARYEPVPWLALFVDVENLFDSEHETFGVLGDASEVLPGVSDPRFVSPGAPLSIYAGLGARLD